MRRTDIPATKSNLIRLKEHFGFVRTAREQLDQKRDVLLEEIIAIYREARQVRHDVEAALAAVYATVREALLAGGRAPLEMEALARVGSQRLRMRERSIMGVIVPLLDLEVTDPPGPTAAPGWTVASAARAQHQVRHLLPALVRLAEIEVSCARLASELQKTKRRVNALEHIFIPEHRDTIQFIEAALEEKEREALFQLKRLRGRRKETA
ncbi:MAG: V-type ATP synthase subunit D [Candidatus Binatia bacterium]